MVKFVILISEASVMAGLAALAVMLIRLAMKKAPKRWAYALWAVVFFRCLCPFSAESALSLFNVMPERTPEKTIEVMDSSGNVSEVNYYASVILQVERNLKNYGYSTPPSAAAPAASSKPVPKKNPLHMYYVIFAVWAVGAGAMVLYGVISYILLMRKLKTAVKTEDGVYESDLISTAFSAGFFPPKIYVPCGLFEEERKLIVAHERVHIKRLDYIVKPLAFIGLTVHWFNPLIWLSFALMTRDMELSCDEAVLKIFGAGEKKAYSEALLHVSMKRSGLIDNYKFMPLAFAETGIKGRVKNVLKYKKPTLIVTVLAAAVVIAACAALGTNAKSKAEDMDVKYVLLQNGVNNILSDADGEQIILFKELNNSTEKGIAEGETSFDSVVFPFDMGFIGHFIMDADITELKINSLDVYQEDGKNILKMLIAFKVDEDFVNHGQNVSGYSFKYKLRYRMTEGSEGVYTVSAECELEEDGSNGYSFMLYGFDDIPVYVNADLVKPDETVYTSLDDGIASVTEEKAAEYTAVSAGWVQFTLETGETGYAAYDVNSIPINADDWTFSTKGITGKGVSIGCFTTFGEDSGEADFRSVLDFGDHPITAVTVENMYTERIRSNVKLYTKIKVATPTAGGIMNHMAVNDGDFEMAVEEYENGEQLFTILKEYNIHEDVTASFAVVVDGFDDVPVYVNSALDPVQMPVVSINYMKDNLSEEEKARIEEEFRKGWEEAVKKQRQEEERKREEEEQRKLAEEKQKELFEYEGAAKYGIEFIEGALKEGNVSAAYLNGTNVLILFDDGTFWYDLILTNYSHFPHQTDYTLNDGVLVLNYKDGGALYFKQEDDKLIFDESSSKRGSTMEAPFFEDGYTLTSYETVVGGTVEAEEMLRSSRPLQYPVDGVVTAGYGDGRGHKGIDFAAEAGTEVYAAADGTVSETGSYWNGGYGNSVTIDHRIDMETVYAHLQDVTVKEGDKVKKGDLIGHAGSTGDTTQNGIHFEVKINGVWKDPADYIAQSESNSEKAVLAWYLGTDTITGITLYNDGTFLVENYASSFWLPERPEKSYKFENGILSLEYTNGSVQCLEAVGNDLVYRKDLSDENYITGMPSVNDTFELRSGTSLNGGRIEMEPLELNGKTYYLVSNETQLRAIGGSVYGLDKNYMQQCDIELSPDEWKAIGTRANPFTGSYNGNGFEIKGLTMVDPKAPLIGMFGCAENAEIYNITLRDYDIEKAGSSAKKKTVAPILAINYGSRVYDNNIYPKE